MDLIRRHLSYANVAATMALALAMAGGALAATGSFSSGGKLQACVNSEGALRLVKPGKRCAKGQKAVTWNQEGPAGARGATGAPGADGPRGEKGPEGPSGEPTNIKWAAIENGNSPKIAAGHGVVAVAESNTPTAHFAVAFNSDIEDCAVVASQHGESGVAVYVEKAGSEAKVYLTNGPSQVLSDFSIIAIC